MTVQGPVKEQQPDGMSHRGHGGDEADRASNHVDAVWVPAAQWLWGPSGQGMREFYSHCGDYCCPFCQTQAAHVSFAAFLRVSKHQSRALRYCQGSHSHLRALFSAAPQSSFGAHPTVSGPAMGLARHAFPSRRGPAEVCAADHATIQSGRALLAVRAQCGAPGGAARLGPCMRPPPPPPEF